MTIKTILIEKVDILFGDKLVKIWPKTNVFVFVFVFVFVIVFVSVCVSLSLSLSVSLCASPSRGPRFEAGKPVQASLIRAFCRHTDQYGSYTDTDQY